MNALEIIFLLLFGITLVSSYLVIRRNLMKIQVAGSLCASLSVTFLFGYGLAKDLYMAHAVATAFFVGLGFSAAVVAMAAFFRANEPAALEAYLKKDTPSSN